MVEANTTPTITPTVTGKLPVPSSTRNTMVSGAPITAAATDPMPTIISAVCCSTRWAQQVADDIGERRAEQAAEEQRRAEHAAAEPGAQRDRRRQQLGHQQEQQQRQREIAVEHELDGAVAAAQHLRHEERDGAHQQAAHRRPQPLRQRQAAQRALRPGHRLHRQHAEAGGQDAEQREQQIEPLAEVEDGADAEQGRRDPSARAR